MPLVTPTRNEISSSSTVEARQRAANLAMANDGVFANLSAKPTAGSDKPAEEHPPVSYIIYLPYHILLISD